MELALRLRHFTVLLPIMICMASASSAQTLLPAKPQAEAPRDGTIPLYQSQKRVIIMMRIGEGPVLPMLFDTGTDGHAIDQSVAASQKLKRIGVATVVDGTTGNERILPRVAIDNVRLGSLQVGRIEAVAQKYVRDDAMGIISAHMFTGSLVYIELGKSRVRLVPKDKAPLPDAPANPFLDNLPAINIGMPDGSSLPATIDTGYNGALSLPIAMMDKVQLMAPAKSVGRFRSPGAEGEFYGGKIRGKIRIGAIVLENPDVVFLGQLANIGLPIIRQLTLVIDPAEKRNWVLDPSAATAASK